MSSFTRSLILFASASAVVAVPANAGITGAGSTFVYPVLSRWAADFKKAGGSASHAVPNSTASGTITQSQTSSMSG